MSQVKVYIGTKDSAHPEEFDGPARYLNPWAAAAIIASWNTTSTLINFPNVFGKLGTLGGCFFVLLLQGLGYLVTLHMIDLIKFYKDKGFPLETFGELGERLYGITGRRFFLIIQMSNQIGFLPYAMVLMVDCIKTFFPNVEFLQCNFHTCILVILIGYALVQVSRDWKDFHWLAYVTWFLALVMTVLLIGYCLTHQATYGAQVTPAFVGMDFVCSPNSTVTCLEPEEQYSFLSVMSGIGSILFSFAPCFIITELMSEMEKPGEHAKTALTVAFSFSSCVYIAMGLSFSVYWGNQVPGAVYSSALPKGGWANLTSCVIIFIAMILDFVISVLVINRQTISSFRPDFDYAWTWKNAITWATVTSVPCTLTFLLTMFIPNLEAIIGFVDAFAIPYAQFVAPCLFSLEYFQNKRRGIDQNMETIQTPYLALSRAKRILMYISLTYGISISAIKTGIFIYSLTQLTFDGDYWCDLIAAL